MGIANIDGVENKSRKWKYDEWTNYINSDSDLLIESEIMNWTLRRIWTLFDIEVESEQITYNLQKKY